MRTLPRRQRSRPFAMLACLGLALLFSTACAADPVPAVPTGSATAAPAAAPAAQATPAAAPAGKSLWTDSVPEAMKTAAAEKKDLLFDFTGSDWCHWCIKLHEEVFDHEPFQTEAPKKFVLVTLDFPNDTSKLSEATQKQNSDWKAKLGPSGFPTIFLTDEQGVPYAKTGYQPGGAEKYMAHLNELAQVHTKRDEALARAATATGVEKAKALDSALTAVGDELAVAHYADQVQEVVALDADNQAGLKAKYEQLLHNDAVKKVVAKVNAEFAGTRPYEFIKQLDEAQAQYKPTGAARMELFSAKLGILSATGKHEAALKAAQDLLADKTLDADDRLEASLQLSGIYSTLERPDDAVKVFDDLLAAEDPKGERRFALYYYKAQTLAGAGKMEAALKAMDEAIAAAPDEETKKQLEKAKSGFHAAPAPPAAPEAPGAPAEAPQQP